MAAIAATITAQIIIATETDGKQKDRSLRLKNTVRVHSALTVFVISSRKVKSTLPFERTVICDTMIFRSCPPRASGIPAYLAYEA